MWLKNLKEVKMKKVLKRTLCVVLSALMITTTIPVSTFANSKPAAVKVQKNEKSKAVTPDKVNDAIKNFAQAVNYFSTSTEEMTMLTSFLTRFGGVTSLASGAIGILQMCGIIKDPSLELLGKILDEVRDIKEQLVDINKQITDINNRLVEIQVEQKEENRNSTANSMITAWNTFNTNYNEPLDRMIDEYERKVTRRIETWWDQGSQTSVRVIYTTLEDGKVALTYTNEAYNAGVPEKSANEEEVIANESFGMPAEYLPDTTTLPEFDADHYRDNYENAVAEKFKEAMDAHAVDAEDAFYTKWNGLSATQKNEKAIAYAKDIFNTQIYHLSCDEISDEKNDQWVIDVLNAYKTYSENATTTNSGINAMINAIYLTHGFEGEAKKDLQDFCNGMIVKAGIYGEFAITVASQDRLQTTEKRKEISDTNINLLNALSEKRDLAFTGYDDFCYVTGTRMKLDKVKATSEISGKVSNIGIMFGQYKASGWNLSVPNILNEVYSKVLYNQYRVNNTDNASFVTYLNKANTGVPSNYNGVVMTKYDDIKDFKLSEGLDMKATQVINSRTQLGIDERENITGKKYKINTGNTGFNDFDFEVHDGITYEGMDLTNGATMKNQWAARAFYEDFTLKAQTFNFHTTNIDETFNLDTVKGGAVGGGLNLNFITPGREWKEQYTTSIDILKLNPCMDTNGDDASPNNPFYAFDSPVLEEGVSDVIGPVIQHNKPAITNIYFKSSSYSYTGKTIKPKVIVKSGTKTVPSSEYTVKYFRGKEIGAGVVKVKAKGGKYVGSHSKAFVIAPKGTKIKSIKKGKKSVTLKWKKQKSKMPKKRIKGYQIRYATKSSMKKAKTVTVKGYKKTSKKIKGLKKNKKYYFQIRTYMTINKVKIHSKWSKKKKAKTR